MDLVSMQTSGWAAKVVTITLAFGGRESQIIVITPGTRTWNVVARLGYGPQFELLLEPQESALGWNDRLWPVLAAREPS